MAFGDYRFESAILSPDLANGGKAIPLKLSGGVIKEIVMRLSVTLATPGASTPAATPRSESIAAILRDIALNLNGTKYWNIDGGSLRTINFIDNAGTNGELSSTLTAPAAGASSTLVCTLVLPCALQNMFAKKSSVAGAVAVDNVCPGLIDTANFDDKVWLELTFGTILDLFATANDTTITACTVDVTAVKVMGISIAKGSQLIYEVQKQVEALTSTDANKIIQLPADSNFDYRGILLKTMSDGYTPAGSILNKITLRIRNKDGSKIVLRDLLSESSLRAYNQLKVGGALPTGYQWVDFCEDGNIAGVINMANVANFELVGDITGAATNKVEILRHVLTLKK